MLYGLSLKDVPPFANCDLEFGDRLNILTGDNGVGKTFLLNLVWTALTTNWSNFKSWFDAAAEGSPLVTVRAPRPETNTDFVADWEYSFRLSRWMNIGSRGTEVKSGTRWSGPVIFLESNGNSKVWDPARLGPSKRKASALEFTPHTLLDGLGQGKSIACEGLVRDWVAWQRSSDPLFELLGRVLKILSESSEILIPGEPQRLSVEDVREFPTLKLPYGEVPYQATGSGIQRIVGLAYLLVWTWQQHLQASELRRMEPTKRIVLLLDEVETHLHPRWQQRVIPAIMEAVSELTRHRVEAQVFTSTHSPLVLASVETLFDHQHDKWLNSKLKHGLAEIRNLPWSKFGDAAGWLTSPAFQLPSGGYSVEAEQAMNDADNLMASRSETGLRSMPSIHEINERLSRALNPDDPYWTFWEPYYQQQMEKHSDSGN